MVTARAVFVAWKTTRFRRTTGFSRGRHEAAAIWGRGERVPARARTPSALCNSCWKVRYAMGATWDKRRGGGMGRLRRLCSWASDGPRSTILPETTRARRRNVNDLGVRLVPIAGRVTTQSMPLMKCDIKIQRELIHCASLMDLSVSSAAQTRTQWRPGRWAVLGRALRAPLKSVFVSLLVDCV